MYYKTLIDNYDSLIIKKSGKYFDVLSGQYYKKDDIIYGKLLHEELSGLLEALKDSGLDYFIKGYNDINICTKNTGYLLRHIGDNLISASFMGWTRGVPKKLFEDIYNKIYQIGCYTIWNNDTFVYFLKECLQGGWVITKDKLPPRKYYLNKGGVNPKFIGEVKRFISFGEKILALMEDGDQNELESIISRYDISKILEWYDLSKSNINEFNEKMSGIYNKNNYKILTYFLNK